jgi:hypothetical protein
VVVEVILEKVITSPWASRSELAINEFEASRCLLRV